MGNEVLELVIQFLMELRMPDVAGRSEEYQEAHREEGRLHDRLADDLTDAQNEKLEDFISGANEKGAIYEKLCYQQGMKDILSLLVSLLAMR